MSALDRWLDARRPKAPDELAESLRAGLDRSDGAGPIVERLTRGALGHFELMSLEHGKVRDDAFHLLAADALITYACESALETDDVEGALTRILQVGSGP